MAQIVIGLFEDYDRAQEVVQALVAEGYSRGDIQVRSNDDSRSTASGDARTGDDRGDGVMDRIGNFFSSMFGDDADERDTRYYSDAVDSGRVVVAVTVNDGARVDRTVDIMEEYDAIDVDEDGQAYESGRSVTANSSDRGEVRIPVVEEDIQVGKRPVQRGGVRVYTHTSEVPVDESVTLREERVRVDRRPVDRPANATDIEAFEEGEIEISETAEEPVVRKQARVVEEVIIGKDVEEHTETIRDTVRRTDVEVEDKKASKSTNRR